MKAEDKAESETNNVGDTSMDSYVCVCGKKDIKSKSGLSLHRKKCEEYQKSLSNGAVEKPAPKPIGFVGVGSVITLNGPVWWQDPTNFEWEYGNTNVDVDVEVKSRETTNTGCVVLICKSVDGNAVWSVEEHRVMSGELKLARFVPFLEVVNPVINNDFSKPVAGKRVECEDTETNQFVISADNYVSARDAKLDAEKVFKKIDKNERPIIETFIRNHGVETKPDLGDFKVQDYGYIAHLVKTPGKPGVKRNLEEIIGWCKKNGYSECLTEVLNTEMWEALKKTGKVPSEFITEVEEPIPAEDKFSLQIKRDADYEG